jgi:hypothetical protein
MSTTQKTNLNLFAVELSALDTPQASTATGPTLESQLMRVMTEAGIGVQETLDSDFSGRTRYSMPNPRGEGSGETTSQFLSDSSVFRDSGLPTIQDLGSFVESVVPRFSDGGVVPFFELGDASIGHLWSARNLIQRNNSRRKFGDLFRFLTQMKWRDSEEWQGLRSERWMAQHRGLLAFYFTELFAGRFVDRNGTAMSFTLGVDFSDLSSLSNLKLSPDFAGSIVGTFVEFLGDRVFQVPYYAPSLLKHYQTHRSLEASIAKNELNLDRITEAIANGSLDAVEAEELNLPLSGDLDWTVLAKSNDDDSMPIDPASISPIVGSRLCRLLVRKVSALDAEFQEQSIQLAASELENSSIENGSSKLQSRFTIHASGIQRKSICCVFLPEESDSCGVHSIAGENDYADLVGRLVKLAGESAEKNVRALVGGVVRGISLFALDNEVVAEVIATAASVASKKAAEAFTYQFLLRFIADQSIPLSQRKELLSRWSEIHQRLAGE